jgi:hypothetical protein
MWFKAKQVVQVLICFGSASFFAMLFLKCWLVERLLVYGRTTAAAGTAKLPLLLLVVMLNLPYLRCQRSAVVDSTASPMSDYQRTEPTTAIVRLLEPASPTDVWKPCR